MNIDLHILGLWWAHHSQMNFRKLVAIFFPSLINWYLKKVQPICRASVETQTDRTDLWAQWGKEREGGIESSSWEHKHSVQFSHLVVTYSLWSHGLQHTRPPCPSPTPRVHPNPCRWCHPTISSSVFPFSSYLHSYKHQGLFKWVSSLHQEAQVLEFQLQHQSFQWIFRTDLL